MSKGVCMSNLSINSFITPNYNICNKYTGKVTPQTQLKTNNIDTVNFTGDKQKKASGTFADKKFTVDCRDSLTNRRLSGTIDDLDFNIKHQGKFFKADTLTGNIGDKDLKLKVGEGLFTKTIEGNIGEQPVNLKVSDTWSGYRIKGQFKDKDVDIKLNSKLVGYGLESDNMSLRIKSKTLFGNDVNVKGTYNEDPDLIPILMDMVYCLNMEEAMTMLLL